MGYAYVQEIFGSRGERIRSRADLLRLSKKGISKASLMSLARSLSLSLKEIAALLQVSERTLQRYTGRELLSVAISGRIVQLAEVFAAGVDAFGEKERFVGWLKTPNTALSGETPLDLLDTAVGTQMVLDEIGRLVHGVHS